MKYFFYQKRWKHHVKMHHHTVTHHIFSYIRILFIFFLISYFKIIWHYICLKASSSALFIVIYFCTIFDIITHKSDIDIKQRLSKRLSLNSQCKKSERKKNIIKFYNHLKFTVIYMSYFRIQFNEKKKKNRTISIHFFIFNKNLDIDKFAKGLVTLILY